MSKSVFLTHLPYCRIVFLKLDWVENNSIIAQHLKGKRLQLRYNWKWKKQKSERKKQDKKIAHFRNLDINSVSDNKTFWQIVKPLFLNKVKAKPVTKSVGNKKDDWRWKWNYQNI